MIISEKILSLRKKAGYSQEELAEQLNVSRQSVSKWESGASVPDITKILELSKLFGVTTDFLLKDELEVEELLIEEEGSLERKVSAEEANSYITAMKQYTVRISIGVVLCILSPLALILLASGSLFLPPTAGPGITIGLTVLFLMVTAAVAIFITSLGNIEKYNYIKMQAFSLEYGVRGIMSQKKELMLKNYPMRIAIGTVLCIVASLPLVLAGAFGAPESVVIRMLIPLLLIVSAAVSILVQTVMQKGAYDLLLQEGEYLPAKAEERKKSEKLAGVYWPIVVAAYLLWSFTTMNWAFTWIIWPVAALVFAGIVNLVGNEA